MGKGGGAGGFKFSDRGNIFGGVGALTKAYVGYKALKLSEDQFAFGKDTFNKNLANEAQLTNTALADRQRSRLFAQGQEGNQSETSLQSYIDQNKVSGAPV